jgi:hypothetical protein
MAADMTAAGLLGSRRPGVPAHPVNSGCIDPMWFSASEHRMLLPCFQHRPGTPGVTFIGGTRPIRNPSP